MQHSTGLGTLGLWTLLVAVPAVLFSGCGGAAVVVVCVGINTPPGFCEPGQRPAARVVTIKNDCPFTVDMVAAGKSARSVSRRWALAEHGMPGDSAEFRVPVTWEQSESWSGVLSPADSGAAADLTLVRFGSDRYKVDPRENPAVPMILQPDQTTSRAESKDGAWCTPATSSQPAVEPHACRTDGNENRARYVLTLCPVSGSSQH